jgi:hypothetical protein
MDTVARLDGISPQLHELAGALHSSRHERPLTAAEVWGKVQAMEMKLRLEVVAPIATHVQRRQGRAAPL